MDKIFSPPNRNVSDFNPGDKCMGRDGRTWEAVVSNKGEKRWLPLGRKTRRLYVAQQSARTRVPRSPDAGSRPNPVLDWIRAHPQQLKALAAGSEFKIAKDRAGLIKQARQLRDGWEAITTRNQDLSDERLAGESTAALKKIVTDYMAPDMMGILAQWLASLVVKALNYRKK
jgi:hypothetical protein